MITVYLNVKSCRLVEMLQNYGDVCCLLDCSELCVCVAGTVCSLNHYVTVHGELVLTRIIA
jgi:hypothetical protein